VFAARTLIHRCVQLERDLIRAISDVQDKTAPLTTMRTGEDPGGEPVLNQRAWSWVEPGARKSQHARDIFDGVKESGRQSIDRNEPPAFDLGDDIDISRRTRDQAEQLERATTNRQEFIVEAAFQE
jgi:hypothetical protein